MFLYLHDGIVWGEPRCVYDMAYYKLTDEEVAKIPPVDQFTEHERWWEDDDWLPEMLQVQFPETKVGTRLFLSKCRGLSFRKLASEEHVLATLMSTHRRLGPISQLSKLSPEVQEMIVKFTFQA